MPNILPSFLLFPLLILLLLLPPLASPTPLRVQLPNGTYMRVQSEGLTWKALLSLAGSAGTPPPSEPELRVVEGRTGEGVVEGNFDEVVGRCGRGDVLRLVRVARQGGGLGGREKLEDAKDKHKAKRQVR